MYTLIRKVHVYSGFSIAGFLLMYFLTGFMLTHHQWFGEGEGKEEEKTVQLEALPEVLGKEGISYFRETFYLKGKAERPQYRDNGEVMLEYQKPGTRYEVLIAPDRQTAKIHTFHESAYDVGVVLHRMHGYGGGGLLYDVYIFMMDLSSLSLILFAVTGVFLWLKLKLSKGDPLGIALLVLSIGYTIGVMYALLLA